MRRLLRDAEDLVQLALLFAIGVATFLVVSALRVPTAFGELGHIRTGAVVDGQRREPFYAGRTAYAECHDEVAARPAKAIHAMVDGGSCHGAPAARIAVSDTVKPAALEVVPLCSRCHAENQAGPKHQPKVDIEQPSEGNACTECHDAHSPAQ